MFKITRKITRAEDGRASRQRRGQAAQLPGPPDKRCAVGPEGALQAREARGNGATGHTAVPRNAAGRSGGRERTHRAIGGRAPALGGGVSTGL